ncbi:MAG TPA: hypothetical protein VHI13_05350 [Candidatus Kapabacteria bacterium]|nr:hypothetical protein [Candidatus Kapabacteria bacterium]
MQEKLNAREGRNSTVPPEDAAAIWQLLHTAEFRGIIAEIASERGVTHSAAHQALRRGSVAYIARAIAKITERRRQSTALRRLLADVPGESPEHSSEDTG